MNNCIYRFKDNKNKIIYIGKARKLIERIKTHRHLPEECYRSIDKIEFVSFDSYDDTDIVERYLISKLKPRFNREFSDRKVTITIDFIDNLKWTVLDKSKYQNFFDNRFIESKEVSIIIEDIDVLEGNNIIKSIRLNEVILDMWNIFTEKTNVDKHTLMAQALKEYMEKYK